MNSARKSPRPGWSACGVGAAWWLVVWVWCEDKGWLWGLVEVEVADEVAEDGGVFADVGSGVGAAVGFGVEALAV